MVNPSTIFNAVLGFMMYGIIGNVLLLVFIAVILFIVSCQGSYK